MHAMRSTLVLTGAAALMAASVAHAAIIDLTTLNATYTDPTAGVLFAEGVAGPSGTGHFDPFVRISGSGGVEGGYNTSVNKPPFDAKSGKWTRDVLLHEFAPTAVGGHEYILISLDLNDPNGGQTGLLSMDKFQIYLTSVPSQGVATFTGDDLDLASATKIYDLGAGNRVELNGSLQAGSGHQNMTVSIPADLMAGSDSAATYFVLYTHFGIPNAAGGGFEEFALDSGPGGVGGFDPPPMPEPASLGMLSLGALALLARRRR